MDRSWFCGATLSLHWLSGPEEVVLMGEHQTFGAALSIGYLSELALLRAYGMLTTAVHIKVVMEVKGICEALFG